MHFALSKRVVKEPYRKIEIRENYAGVYVQVVWQLEHVAEEPRMASSSGTV